VRPGATIALAIAIALGVCAGPSAADDEPSASLRVAVFDVGDATVRTAVASALRAHGYGVLDPQLVDTAARGARYSGSLNLGRDEARRLGQVVGATVLVLGTVSTVERESDNATHYWDSFVGLFLVDGVSGALLRYRGCRATAGDGAGALEKAMAAVRAEVASWGTLLAGAVARREQSGRDDGWDPAAVDLVSQSETAADVTPPRFFKRPAPSFTDDAERVHAVATVDLVVQFNADGTYGPVEVVRWAGFGLDEGAVEAVRAARFWPAKRDGHPVPARALLRYNFRYRER
jgi:TonB-like protein